MNSIFNYKENYFGKVILNPSTLVRSIHSPNTIKEILSFHEQLVTDKYTEYVQQFYKMSVENFGDDWVYMDIVNTLYATTKMIKPSNYLEIGVRRGRSVCTVARANPNVDIYAFDMWVENYAGMENPGPKFVQDELKAHGHEGDVHFFDGNSRETIPQFFHKNPTMTFDLITVDGDHSEEGAYIDLKNTIPYLSVGGVVVFDDISHPAHPYLNDVWKRICNEFSYLKSYEYNELGYGVAFAIRESD